MDRQSFLGKESIMHLLVRLSLPATIGMTINALYNMVDVIFIGRGVGAIGIDSTIIFLPFQLLISSVGIMVGVGAASLFSRYLGSGDRSQLNAIAGNLIFVVGLSSLIFSIVGFLFAPQLVMLLGGKEAVAESAIVYMRSMMPGVLFLPICIAFNNLIRAEGNVRYGMYMMLIGLVSNIFLDYIFIFSFDWGVAGAGWASSIAKSLSFLFLLWYLRRRSIIKVRSSHIRFNHQLMINIVAVGSSAFIVQLSLSLGVLVVNHLFNYFSAAVDLTIYGIIFRLSLILMMPLIGISQGLSPIVGYNFGAKKGERVQEALQKSIMITVVVGVFYLLFCELFAEVILSWFSHDEQVVRHGGEVLRVVVIFSPLIGIYMCAVAFFQAVGSAKIAFWLSILRQFVLFIPLCIILGVFFELKSWGVWFALPLADFGAVIVAVVALVFYRKKSIS